MILQLLSKVNFNYYIKISILYNYLKHGTQIHLDTVKKLGKFIEFEKQTADNPKTVEKDRLILEKLMEKLEIDQSNLESLSYSDLVQT